MQFALSVVFTLGFFAVTAVVTLGRAHIPDGLIRLADTLFGGMLAIETQIVGYWFARQRNAVSSG